MDKLLLQIVAFMKDAQADKLLVNGHDKKACVLHKALELTNNIFETTAESQLFLDSIIDTICIINNNRNLLDERDVINAQSICQGYPQ